MPFAKQKAIIDAVDYITVILASVSVASDTFGFRFVLCLLSYVFHMFE